MEEPVIKIEDLGDLSDLTNPIYEQLQHNAMTARELLGIPYDGKPLRGKKRKAAQEIEKTLLKHGKNVIRCCPRMLCVENFIKEDKKYYNLEWFKEYSLQYLSKQTKKIFENNSAEFEDALQVYKRDELYFTSARQIDKHTPHSRLKMAGLDSFEKYSHAAVINYLRFASLHGFTMEPTFVKNFFGYPTTSMKRRKTGTKVTFDDMLVAALGDATTLELGIYQNGIALQNEAIHKQILRKYMKSVNPDIMLHEGEQLKDSNGSTFLFPDLYMSAPDRKLAAAIEIKTYKQESQIDTDIQMIPQLIKYCGADYPMIWYVVSKDSPFSEMLNSTGEEITVEGIKGRVMTGRDILDQTYAATEKLRKLPKIAPGHAVSREEGILRRMRAKLYYAVDTSKAQLTRKTIFYMHGDAVNQLLWPGENTAEQVKKIIKSKEFDLILAFTGGSAFMKMLNEQHLTHEMDRLYMISFIPIPRG
ncbi:MAG: hypothetical protein ABIG20_03550 [archaeon]